MSIAKHTGDFIHSLVELHLIPSSHIETVPTPDSDFELDFSNFSLKTGKSFEKIYFSPQSGNYQENENEESGGKIYTKKIGFRIPKNRSEVTAWFRDRRNHRFSAMLKLADGSWWFAEKNLSITMMRNFPEDSARFAGYEITIQGRHNEPTPVVTGVTLT